MPELSRYSFRSSDGEDEGHEITPDLQLMYTATTMLCVGYMKRVRGDRRTRRGAKAGGRRCDDAPLHPAVLLHLQLMSLMSLMALVDLSYLHLSSAGNALAG
jgi:hypothetical protein